MIKLNSPQGVHGCPIQTSFPHGSHFDGHNESQCLWWFLPECDHNEEDQWQMEGHHRKCTCQAKHYSNFEIQHSNFQISVVSPDCSSTIIILRSVTIGCNILHFCKILLFIKWLKTLLQLFSFLLYLNIFWLQPTKLNITSMKTSAGT